MFVELDDDEREELIFLVNSTVTIPMGERDNLIKRLQPSIKRERMSTSCILWKDQVERATRSDNASQWYRDMIDLGLKNSKEGV